MAWLQGFPKGNEMEKVPGPHSLDSICADCDFNCVSQIAKAQGLASTGPLRGGMELNGCPQNCPGK